MDAAERLAIWQTQIETIRDDLQEVFWNRKLFRAVREMFRTNLLLQEHGTHVWDWLSGLYATDAAMHVRRDLDKQGGTVNLKNLLHDIEDHFEVLGLSRAAALPASSDVVRRDREDLVAATEKVRAYAERLIAHRSPEPPTSINWLELDAALRAVRKVLRAYYGHLKATDLFSATPEPQFDFLAPFRTSWIGPGFEEPEDEEEGPISDEERKRRRELRARLGFAP